MIAQIKHIGNIVKSSAESFAEETRRRVAHFFFFFFFFFFEKKFGCPGLPDKKVDFVTFTPYGMKEVPNFFYSSTFYWVVQNSVVDFACLEALQPKSETRQTSWDLSKKKKKKKKKKKAHPPRPLPPGHLNGDLNASHHEPHQASSHRGHGLPDSWARCSWSVATS
jgi:hypothetical protein